MEDYEVWEAFEELRTARSAYDQATPGTYGRLMAARRTAYQALKDRHDTGTSYYRLAQISGVDRTTVRKILTEGSI